MLQSAASASTNATAYIVAPATGQPVSIPLTPRRPNGQVDYGPTRGQPLAANIAAVQRVLDNEAARGPFDLLNTIAAAVRVAPPPATLIVLSSGLSTAGGLDMRQVGWDASPASVAAQLKARGLLPSLAGYRVIFSGLADTSGRQPALPLPQRRMLTAIWLAICEASGAASCSTDEMTRPDPPSRSTTPVPLVPVPTVPSVTGPGNHHDHRAGRAAVPVRQPDAPCRPPTHPPARRSARPAARTAVSITGYASPDGGTTAYNIALSRRARRSDRLCPRPSCRPDHRGHRRRHRRQDPGCVPGPGPAGRGRMRAAAPGRHQAMCPPQPPTHDLQVLIAPCGLLAVLYCRVVLELNDWVHCDLLDSPTGLAALGLGPPAACAQVGLVDYRPRQAPDAHAVPRRRQTTPCPSASPRRRPSSWARSFRRDWGKISARRRHRRRPSPRRSRQTVRTVAAKISRRPANQSYRRSDKSVGNFRDYRDPLGLPVAVPAGSWLAAMRSAAPAAILDLVARFQPGFVRTNFVEVIQASAWPQ